MGLVGLARGIELDGGCIALTNPTNAPPLRPRSRIRTYMVWARPPKKPWLPGREPGIPNVSPAPGATPAHLNDPCSLAPSPPL